MAPKAGIDLVLAFGLVLAMTVIVLAITTWADHFPNPESNSAAPNDRNGVPGLHEFALKIDPAQPRHADIENEFDAAYKQRAPELQPFSIRQYR